jgi:hypothetical protein
MNAHFRAGDGSDAVRPFHEGMLLDPTVWTTPKPEIEWAISCAPEKSCQRLL